MTVVSLLLAFGLTLAGGLDGDPAARAARLTSGWLAPGPPGGTGPTRLLVVTGGHDYPTSFYTLFEGHDGIVWDHATSAEEAYRRDIRPLYDVLVLYDMPKDLPPAARANLQAFAEAGKGLLILHHALVSYPGWAWYEQLAGGRYHEKATDGRPASTYQHDVKFTVRPAGQHPVTAGIGPLDVLDETYNHVWQAAAITPLLTTDHPASNRIVAWISPYRGSRVVVIQPGHGPEIHRHPGYRRLVSQALRWVGEEARRGR